MITLYFSPTKTLEDRFFFLLQTRKLKPKEGNFLRKVSTPVYFPLDVSLKLLFFLSMRIKFLT